MIASRLARIGSRLLPGRPVPTRVSICERIASTACERSDSLAASLMEVLAMGVIGKHRAPESGSSPDADRPGGENV